MVDDRCEEKSRAENPDDCPWIEGDVRFALLLVVGQHLVHGGGKCGVCLAVLVVFEIGDEVVCEVLDAVLVSDALAHLVVGGDVEITVFRREEEDDRAVCAAVHDLIDDRVCDLTEHLSVRVLDVADEDAHAVRFFKGGDAGIEFLLLGIGEEIRLVDHACVSDGRGIRRPWCGEDEKAEAEEEQDENGAVS